MAVVVWLAEVLYYDFYNLLHSVRPTAWPTLPLQPPRLSTQATRSLRPLPLASPTRSDPARAYPQRRCTFVHALQHPAQLLASSLPSSARRVSSRQTITRLASTPATWPMAPAAEVDSRVEGYLGGLAGTSEPFFGLECFMACCEREVGGGSGARGYLQA
ncbi:hypothetical protein BJY59DRAFT_701055 [Rhodotorula toruloides]